MGIIVATYCLDGGLIYISISLLSAMSHLHECVNGNC